MNRLKYLLNYLLILLCFSSCIPNKKLVLLQKDDANSKVVTDTVLRTYTLDTTSYVIQCNDILLVKFESITAAEYDFLTRAQSVNAGGRANGALALGELVGVDGTIKFPEVGRVEVAGLTLMEAEEKLQRYAERYLEKPIVKVRLLNFRFTVLGEVNKEGTVTSSNHVVSLMEALGLSGGMTDLADRSRVKIVRQVGGDVNVFYVNLLEEELLSSPFYRVNQNDVIIVPSLKQRPIRKYYRENLSIVVSSITALLLAISIFVNN